MPRYFTSSEAKGLKLDGMFRAESSKLFLGVGTVWDVGLNLVFIHERPA